ncbi:hypothetical protein DFJ64_1661 [Thermasporomyces composti]|jgi:hypothetical protein|uniref:Uncharacterized protein n=1 Tax=Thermasporomyces composti TaxID=696763 RepID=A0A3D9VB62_THECX|nr:hypothetical protein DFJ64_1661 [Thermasporomyces composti]
MNDSQPGGRAVRRAAPRPSYDLGDPPVFCLSHGAGGFGGTYWIDDRAETSPREETTDSSDRQEMSR